MNIRFLKRIVLVGVFSIPFIALFSLDSLFFKFVTTKAFIFRIIIEIIFATWIILLLSGQTARPKFSVILVALLTFIGIIGLADIFGQNFYKSFWGDFERMEGLIGHLHLLAFFLVSTSVLSSEELWKKFLTTSIWISSAISFIGILQIIRLIPMTRSDMRLDLAFGNPLFLASYITFNIFILIWLLKKSEYKKLYWTLVLINLLALYGTASRGAFLGLIIGLFSYFSIIAVLEKNRKTLKILFTFILTITIISGGIFVARNTSFVEKSPVLSRLANSVEFLDSGSNSRLLLWRVAIEGIKEKPILGWGQENFDIVFSRHYDPRMAFGEPWFDRAHSSILDWSIAGGILGLLAYLFLISSGILILWKKKSVFNSEEKAIFSAIFIAYLIQNLFIFDTIMSYIMLFSILGVIHFRSIEGGVEYSGENKLRHLIVPIVVVTTIFIVYTINIKPLIQNHNLRKATEEPDLNTTDNFESFRKGLSVSTFGNREFIGELAMYTNILAMDPSPYSGPNLNDFAQLASREMENYLKINPVDVKMLTIYGSMLGDLGRHNDALLYLNRARKLSPNKEDIITGIAAIKNRAGYYSQSSEDFRYLYELALLLPKTSRYKRYVDIEFNEYVASLIYDGQQIEAENLLMEKYGQKLIAEDPIINAYAHIKRNDIVLKLWQIRASSEPENSQNLVSLAASYLSVGQRDKAIETIRNIYKIDPTFREQGEDMIADILSGKSLNR